MIYRTKGGPPIALEIFLIEQKIENVRSFESRRGPKTRKKEKNLVL